MPLRHSIIRLCANWCPGLSFLWRMFNSMRYLIPALVCLLVWSSGCRKKEYIDDYDFYANGPEVETPEHCDNNEFDYLDGELDVDCGSVCGVPCVIDPNCEDRSISRIEDSYGFETDLDGSYYKSFDNFQADFTSYDSHVRIDVDFYTDSLDVDRKYLTGIYGGDELCIMYYGEQFGELYRARENQEIYTTVSGNTLYVSFCDVEFVDSNDDVFETVSGSLKLSIE